MRDVKGAVVGGMRRRSLQVSALKAATRGAGIARQGAASGCRSPAGHAYLQPVMNAGADSTDEELMAGYRSGDTAAFDELYRRHKGPVYRYLLRQCRDAAAAEELFQDVWMNLIRARHGYVVSAKFTTYLYRIAHNRIVDHYRRRAPGGVVSLDDEDCPALDEAAAPAAGGPDADYERAQWARRLLDLLAGLPAPQREAFVLQQEAGMSIEEIAAATGVSRETAKSRLRYALAKLRQGMEAWR